MAIEYDILTAFSKDEVLEELKKIRQPVEVAVYGSENSFNFGSIIRTSHNFLVSKIYGIDIGWYYKRAAMTTLKFEKQNVEMLSLQSFLDKVQNRNLVSFERRESLETKDIRCFQYPENPILIFGSEKWGVPEPILEKSSSIVSIPVLGLCLDFNIAVACGIALYDFHAKRSLK